MFCMMTPFGLFLRSWFSKVGFLEFGQKLQGLRLRENVKNDGGKKQQFYEQSNRINIFRLDKGLKIRNKTNSVCAK